MLIQCTKKLLDMIDMDVESNVDERPEFSWHANLISVNRKKTIVLCNDSNRYIVVIHGIMAEDFVMIDKIIYDAIEKVFLNECIKPEIINEIKKLSPGIIFSKTAGKSQTAKLNKACDNVLFLSDRIGTEDELAWPDMSKKASWVRVNERLTGARISPAVKLINDLKRMFGENVIGCRAFQLKIFMKLEDHDIWRRITVPMNISFKELHKIIQVLFYWMDYHLHNFTLYHDNAPFIQLVCDEEAFDYPHDEPMVLDHKVRLQGAFTNSAFALYRYDFGDNWHIIIQAEGIINDYDQNYPVCIDGKGNAPPEDVGGESGFDRFLEIINNPKDPEHDDMIAWAGSQGYADFDIKKINSKIKNILYYFF